MTGSPGRTARRSERSRLSPRTLMLVIGGVLLLTIAVAVGITVLASRPGPSPCPDPNGPCSGPPADGVTSGTLMSEPVGLRVLAVVPSPEGSPSASPGSQPPASIPAGHPFRDRTPLVGELGYRTEYDPVIWTVLEHSGRSFVATMAEGRITGRLEAAPTSDLSVEAAIQSRRARLAEEILGLADETAERRLITGTPVIGRYPATLVLLEGSLDSPQGPSGGVTAFILAASDGQLTITVSGVIDDDDRELGLKRIDSWLNQVRWPAEVGP